MDNTKENLVSELKHLLAICNDGKEGYKNAAENAGSSELKALLTTYSIQRAEFADSLRTAIRENGGDPDNETGGPLGAVHRTWMDFKTALTSKDNKAVLDACVTGEKAAVEAYDHALQNNAVNDDLRQILMKHCSNIKEALQHIQKLEHQLAS